MAESPYVVNDVTIPPGVTLTIQPGVVVKVAKDAIAFDVEGALDVGDNSGAQNIITSINDNTGGSASGSTGNPAARDWNTIYVHNGGTVNIANTVIRYGGSDKNNLYGMIHNDGGSLSLDHTIMSNGYAEFIFQADSESHLVVRDSIIGTGCTYGGCDGIDALQGSVDVSNSTFNSLGSGVSINGGVLATENNVFNGGYYAFYVAGAALANHGGNSGPGVIALNNFSIAGDATLPKDGLPYLLMDEMIQPGARLTIASAAKVRMSGRTEVLGTLILGDGTSVEPVLLTSPNDANGTGGTAGCTNCTPQAGDWDGIKVDVGGTLTGHNATIRFAGNAYPWITPDVCAPQPWMPPGMPLPACRASDYIWKAAVLNAGGLVDLDGVKIVDSASKGVRTTLGTTVVKNSSFENMPVGISTEGGKTTATSNAFTNVTMQYENNGGTLISDSTVSKDFYAAVQNASNSWSLHSGATTNSATIKQLPNQWSLYVVDTHDNQQISDGYVWWEVRDDTDGVTGWMAAQKLNTDNSIAEEYLKYDANNQVALQGAATTTPDLLTQDGRLKAFYKAVAHYYDNTDSSKGLYSSNDVVNLSAFKEKGFPMSVIEAIGMHESGGWALNRNDVVTSDYGHGLMQVTDLAAVGAASGVHVPQCEGSVAARSSCYAIDPNGANGEKMYTVTARYYANTPQAIYANVKDGMAILFGKFSLAYRATGGIAPDGVILSAADMGAIGATLRYNQGSPWAIQAVYLAGKLRYDGSQVRAELVNHKAPSDYVNSKFTDDWVGQVQGYCPSGISFTLCLTRTNGHGLTTSANYLSLVADELSSLSDPFATKMKAVSDSVAITWTRSPVELRVTDSQGNVAGLVGGVVREDIANSYVDLDTNMVTLMLPQSDLSYNVFGEATGTYGFVAADTGSDKTLSLVDIPTTPVSRHDISVNWSTLGMSATSGVTMRIDDGDGKIDRILETGNTTVTATQVEQASPVVHTTANISGILRADGWYKDHIDIGLSPQVLGDTLAASYIKIDDAAWRQVTGTTTITTAGTHAIAYYSVSQLGSTEKPQVLTVHIGKMATVVPADYTVLLNAPLPQISNTFSGLVLGATSSEFAISGAPQCEAAAPNTSLAGKYQITCTLGTLSSQVYDFTFATSTLSVQYVFGGYLPPLNANAIYKQNRTIPVKFQLKDARGTVVVAKTLPQWITVQQLGVLSGVPNTDVPDVVPTSGENFKYDAGASQYMYNWSTKSVVPGYWYRIVTKLDDGTIHSIIVGLN